MRERRRPVKVRVSPERKGFALTSERKEQAMRAVLAPEALEAIVEVLRRRDWRVVAPTVRDKAIVYDEIASAAELPVGWKDVQAPGSYTLERRDDEARFGYAVGPQSWKRELLAPSVRLLQIERSNGSLKAVKDAAEPRRTAFFGVRPCEVAAIKIQDRVLVAARTSTRTTWRDARAHSSSPSTAASPRRTASAPRWEPAPRPRTATTSS